MKLLNFLNFTPLPLQLWIKGESMAAVIQATETVEFEDGLKTEVLQEDCLCPYSGHATLESDMQGLGCRPRPSSSVAPGNLSNIDKPNSYSRNLYGMTE